MICNQFAHLLNRRKKAMLFTASVHGSHRLDSTAYRYSPSLRSRRFRAVSGARNEERESISFYGSRSISRATTENFLSLPRRRS